MKFLQNKKIVLGVTAGVAAYKSLELIRLLRKEGAEVRVIMTKHAARLISPQMFHAISGNPVGLEQFYDRQSSFRETPSKNLETPPKSLETPPKNLETPSKNLETPSKSLETPSKSLETPSGDSPLLYAFPHIAFSKNADLFIVVPATANILGKVAHGIGDDLLSTCILCASDIPVLFAPAMNVHMWKNPIVQENVKKLKRHGYRFIGPEQGRLACGDVGDGCLAPLDEIFHQAAYMLAPKDLALKNILVTAGPTREKIDDVRFITNASSGKMGCILTRMAWYRGANVTLVHGPFPISVPSGIKTVPVETADAMYMAVKKHFSSSDVFISAAAVGDFRVLSPQKGKRKKNGPMRFDVQKNVDILKEMGARKKKQKVIGFALESENFMKNAQKKLTEKNLDLIVVNTLESLGSDRMKCAFLTRKSFSKMLFMHKEEVALKILDFVL